MNRAFSIFMLLASGSIILHGCGSSGLTASSHLTNVQLATPNFRIVATNVSGQASKEALLGVSFGLGMASTQLALIPLTEDRMLYKKAMQELWANYEAKNGTAANAKVALVNVRYDFESLNLFLYTKITTVVVADIVAFE